VAVDLTGEAVVFLAGRGLDADERRDLRCGGLLAGKQLIELQAFRLAVRTEVVDLLFESLQVAFGHGEGCLSVLGVPLGGGLGSTGTLQRVLGAIERDV
jgi:hypothetical protein